MVARWASLMQVDLLEVVKHGFARERVYDAIRRLGEDLLRQSVRREVADRDDGFHVERRNFRAFQTMREFIKGKAYDLEAKPFSPGGLDDCIPDIEARGALHGICGDEKGDRKNLASVDQSVGEPRRAIRLIEDEAYFGVDAAESQAYAPGIEGLL